MAKRKRKQLDSKSVWTTAGIAAILAVAALLAAWGAEGGAVSVRSDDALRISEVMTDNLSCALPDAGVRDWVEVKNVSDRAVRMTGCALVDAADPSSVCLLPDATLDAGAYAVIPADGIRLSASGLRLALMNGGSVTDEVDVPPLEADQSYCLDADGTWQRTYAPTPGGANRVAAEPTAVGGILVQRGALEISEVMADNASYYPDENGNYPDYVEIHNISSETVSLAGWFLSNDSAKLRRWAFPEAELAPDARLVVHCSGENRAENGHIHADFRISSKGDTLLLTSPNGAVTSCVTVPEMGADAAYSLVDGAWTDDIAPSPNGANDITGADAAAFAAKGGVVINEIGASMSETDDWIELYNTTAQAVDLSGFGLSDNSGHPRKWRFPEGTVIPPNGMLLIVANGANEGLQTGFCLSADGGYAVTLSDEKGEILDRVYVPEQYRDLSYGRSAAGLRYFTVPTPGTANDAATCEGRAPQPGISVKGGLFKQGDTVTVEIAAPSDCRVYYTLDNTDPTEGSLRYTAPLVISQQTVLRTRVYRDNCLPSLTDTQSYIFDAMNGGGTVYVASLVSDPYNLTSDEAGILVKGSGSTPNYRQDWEREAHIEIFAPDGSPIVSQGCAVRQQGQTCRNQPQQCFKLIARSEYGDNLFRGHIFSNRDYDVCHSFLIRNSSDDASKTRMRDSVIQTLTADEGIMYQETEVCVLYLNGEYWGHYNLREAIHPVQICLHEGWVGREDDIDLILGNNVVQQGSDATFLALVKALKEYGSGSDAAFEAIDSAIDVQNYIDYMCLQIFIGNTDPSNVKRYRLPEGKWRWALYDVDWAFNQDTNSVTRWLTPGGVGNGKHTDNTFFILCMKNPTFRDRFLTCLGQHMATDFAPESIIPLFEARYNLLMNILPEHFARWNESESKYNREVGKLISNINQRPARMLQFLKYCDQLSISKADYERYFGDVMARSNISYESIPKA